MRKAEHLPLTGTATGGVCRPDPGLWTLREAEPPLTSKAEQSLAFESYDSLRSRDEQMFFDWCIGIMEDAGVVGVIWNDYVYKASSLHGEIYPSEGSPYLLVLTRTSVEFDLPEGKDAPIKFEAATVETDGEELEAYQVRAAFNMIRRQAALVRAWKDSTSIASNHSVIFKNFRTLTNEPEIAVDVETALAEFTVVVVPRTPTSRTFNYSIVDAPSPIAYSSRVVDALLSDVAEDAGGVPQPGTVVLAMIRTSWLARRDPEWLAVEASGSSKMQSK